MSFLGTWKIIQFHISCSRLTYIPFSKLCLGLYPLNQMSLIFGKASAWCLSKVAYFWQIWKSYYGSIIIMRENIMLTFPIPGPHWPSIWRFWHDIGQFQERHLEVSRPVSYQNYFDNLCFLIRSVMYKKLLFEVMNILPTYFVHFLKIDKEELFNITYRYLHKQFLGAIFTKKCTFQTK